MKYQLAELIDLPALQALMESLYRATGIKHALIDNQSKVLTAAGWEPVCTEFHRRNPDTCARCEASDRYILDHLHDGPYVGYDCPNGLVDYATPVVIDGQHLANIFTGQMFHSPPDLNFFRRQAAAFGFDEGPYLAAVRQVQIVPREKMPDIMAFLVGLAEMLGRQGLARLRQLEAERELRQLNEELARRVRERTGELQDRNAQLGREILDHQVAEAALRQEKQFSDDIINSLPGIFYMLDSSGHFARWNGRLCEVTGYGAEEVARLHALELFEEDTRPLVQERILEVFAKGESAVEAPLRTKDGRLIPHYFTGRRTIQGENHYLVGLGTDITARKALEAELERQAHEDSLTGLATRRHFFARAEQELLRARRYGKAVSFLMLDVDQFKEVNDRYGHGVGDQVLAGLGALCRASLRAVDVAGRLGGDEFAILLPETGGSQALEVAQRLRRAFAAQEVAAADGVRITCSLSIGVASLEHAENDIDHLSSQADSALYRAKAAGRNRVAKD